MAIASLVCSLVGWICGIGFILGVIFGFVALSQIKQSGQDGRGMAIAGIIIGAAPIVILLSLYIVLAVVRSARAQTPGGDSGASAVVMIVERQAVSPTVAA
jgi:hypothetical protein